MSQARRVLMILGAVFSIIMAVIYAFIAIPAIIAIIGGDAESKISGVICLVFFVAAIVNIVFSFMGKNTNKKGIMVMNIVFGFLSTVVFNAVGGIFGLIEGSKE